MVLSQTQDLQEVCLSLDGIGLMQNMTGRVRGEHKQQEMACTVQRIFMVWVSCVLTQKHKKFVRKFEKKIFSPSTKMLPL